jgi:hypothetical protein
VNELKKSAPIMRDAKAKQKVASGALTFNPEHERMLQSDACPLYFAVGTNIETRVCGHL